MKFKVPHSYSIIFGLIIIMGILTWVLPSGQYQRKFDDHTNQSLIIPNTYHVVDSKPQGLQDILMSLLHGFVSAAEIIGFILIVGGAYGVIIRTGAIDRALHSAIKKLGSKIKILIVMLLFLFALAGSTIGTLEETIPFYLIMVTIMISLGYDAIIGIAVIFLGATTGNMASTLNPFATGVASAIANVDLRDALSERIIYWAISITITISYVLYYAIKVKKHPEKSLIADLRKEHYNHFINHDKSTIEEKKISEAKFSFSDKIVVFSLLALLVTMIYGIVQLEWWMAEISALFLGFAFLTLIVKRINENDFWDGFVNGARDIMPATIVIALAKGIVVIATNGSIIDTILYNSANFLGGLSKELFIVLDLVLEFFIAFLVPSSSGHAALTMSILPPLADLFEIPKSAVITSYQISTGLANMVTPTSGVLMVALSVARVPWGRWVRFVTPLMGIHFLTAIVFLIYTIY